jgi:hypothetical protein
MIKAGVQVSKLVSGHKSDSLFYRYTILDTDQVAAAIQATEQVHAAERAKEKEKPNVVAMR